MANRLADLVRDHIPLEQGLRRELHDVDDVSARVRDHIPLEQGLRLSHPVTIT